MAQSDSTARREVERYLLSAVRRLDDARLVRLLALLRALRLEATS